MKLHYSGKRPAKAILEETPEAPIVRVESTEEEGAKNLLVRGENLRVMKTLLVDPEWRRHPDLVYIDPPFATNTVYKRSRDRTQTVSAAHEDEVAYSDKMTGARFLEFLRERLIFLREIMAPHASIYVHTDYKIGHYVKVVMDEVFGRQNFRNDITRIKCNPKNFRRKGYGNIKDMILFYTKGREFIWNEPTRPLSQDDIERLFPKIDSRGRRYTTTPLHAPGETKNGNTGKEWRGLLPPRGRHWRYDPSVLDDLDRKGLIEWSKTGNPRKIVYADDAMRKGMRLQDIWEFKDPQYPSWPTQKNLALLKTIIQASSNPGQLVLDCFCGSGTTLVAAQELGRHWVGIDKAKKAIEICRFRLKQVEKDLFGNTAGYTYLEENAPKPLVK